tara:strand:+ start:1617 stop:2222 length:606 start_codon:yes stop_codon:yes gene_type:complete
MHGVANGAYFCQQQRTQELSDRLYQRNTTTAPIKMQYSIRPVPTKYVNMPIVDCRRPTNVPCQQKPIYNTHQMFTPSNTLPFSGYQANIDTETKLHNTIFPLQACPQATFIPGTQSDLYQNQHLVAGRQETMTNRLLFKEPKFAPFNPNLCGTGYKLFNNFTRQQVRALPYPYFASNHERSNYKSPSKRNNKSPEHAKPTV